MKVYLALSYKECKYITQINLPRLSCQKRSKEKSPSTVENPSFVKSSKSLSSTPYRVWVMNWIVEFIFYSIFTIAKSISKVS